MNYWTRTPECSSAPRAGRRSTSTPSDLAYLFRIDWPRSCGVEMGYHLAQMIGEPVGQSPDPDVG